jgi:phage-related protein
MSEEQRPLIFIGSSRKDLCEFPEDVRRSMGHALRIAQSGGKHPDAKPLTGEKDFTGAGVLEAVEDWQGDTYRAVYTVRFRERVYLLHAFQKKSKQGIKTSQHDIDVIKSRLRDAKTLHEQYLKRKTDDEQGH